MTFFRPKIGQYTAKISEILGINKNNLNTSYDKFQVIWIIFSHFSAIFGHFCFPILTQPRGSKRPNCYNFFFRDVLLQKYLFLKNNKYTKLNTNTQRADIKYQVAVESIISNIFEYKHEVGSFGPPAPWTFQG